MSPKLETLAAIGAIVAVIAVCPLLGLMVNGIWIPTALDVALFAACMWKIVAESNVRGRLQKAAQNPQPATQQQIQYYIPTPQPTDTSGTPKDYRDEPSTLYDDF